MARFDPDAFTETDEFFAASVVPDESVINSLHLNGYDLKCTAHSVTTVLECRGLSRADAKAMAKSADFNYSDKRTVVFRDTQATVWLNTTMACPLSEGDECRAEARRINEADMWRVIVTHVRTSVSHNYNWPRV